MRRKFGISTMRIAGGVLAVSMLGYQFEEYVNPRLKEHGG